MNRREILDRAINCVCGERDAQYGSPEDNFSIIADFWTTYDQAAHGDRLEGFTASDVAAMMGLVKLARIASGRVQADNYVDLAGYAACGGEIATRGAVEDGQE